METVNTAAAETKVRKNMVAVATKKGFTLPEGFLAAGVVARNAETNQELWLCGCGASVQGEIGGKELHNLYTKSGYRLRKVGAQRVALCGNCSGVNEERARVAAEKAALKAAKSAAKETETSK